MPNACLRQRNLQRPSGDARRLRLSHRGSSHCFRADANAARSYHYAGKCGCNPASLGLVAASGLSLGTLSGPDGSIDTSAPYGHSCEPPVSTPHPFPVHNELPRHARFRSARVVCRRGWPPSRTPARWAASKNVRMFFDDDVLKAATADSTWPIATRWRPWRAYRQHPHPPRRRRPPGHPPHPRRPTRPRRGPPRPRPPGSSRGRPPSPAYQLRVSRAQGRGERHGQPNRCSHQGTLTRLHCPGARGTARARKKSPVWRSTTR